MLWWVNKCSSLRKKPLLTYYVADEGFFLSEHLTFNEGFIEAICEFFTKCENKTLLLGLYQIRVLLLFFFLPGVWGYLAKNYHKREVGAEEGVC